MIFLVNALYFKGAWEDPFKKSATKQDDFHLLDGKRIKVPFMDTSREPHSYRKFDGFEVLNLPYERNNKDCRFSMYVILPKEGDGLEKLIKDFDFSQDFELRIENLLKMQLPKFKFSYDFDATPNLVATGLTLPFEPRGELTGMIDDCEWSKGLAIGQICHKAAIEVNGEGTEAAAVTYGHLLGCCLNYKPPKMPSFVADHPFMFVIKEEISKSVFFVGTVIQPSY